jgi:hypothetical protein
MPNPIIDIIVYTPFTTSTTTTTTTTTTNNNNNNNNNNNTNTRCLLGKYWQVRQRLKVYDVRQNPIDSAFSHRKVFTIIRKRRKLNIGIPTSCWIQV